MEITTRFSFGQPVVFENMVCEITEITVFCDGNIHVVKGDHQDFGTQYCLFRNPLDISPVLEEELNPVVTNEPTSTDIVHGANYWERGLSCMMCNPETGKYDVKLHWYDNEQAHRIPRSEWRRFSDFDSAIDFLCSK